MAEEKKKTVKKAKKTEETSVVETKEAPKSKLNDTWAKMSVAELKVELQKLVLDIKTGREKNTAIAKRLKKHIARELTKSKIK